MSYAITELDRRLANMIRVGTIKEVDLDAGLAGVQLGDPDDDDGDFETDFLPWLVARAGQKRKKWTAPEVGEQVLVLSPSGELSQGFILGGIFQAETAGYEANGDAATLTRETLDENDTYEVLVGGMKLQLTKDAAKIGTSAMNKAARADLVDDRFNKIMQYLTIVNTVIQNFATILEIGMGTPSVFATMLNTAISAGGGLPVITSTAADEVFIK